MSGYNAILYMRRLEKEVNQLGFMMCHPKNRFDEGDMVALKPLDDEAVPIYSRDAEVFVGSLEQLGVWLRGVEWARNYDSMLRVADDKKRARKEQDLRNTQMAQRLKSEKVVQK